MEKNYTSRDIWNKASGAALVIGAIPVIYSLLSLLLAKWTSGSTAVSILKGFLAFVLWSAKFAGCIMLMRMMMDSFIKSFTGVGKSDLFKFGTLIAVLSAFIVSAFDLVDCVFIEPDKFKSLMDVYTSQAASKLDANSLETLNRLSDYFPQITFISRFLYCTIFGTVLSAIFAGSLTASNPFEGNDQPEEF